MSMSRAAAGLCVVGATVAGTGDAGAAAGSVAGVGAGVLTSVLVDVMAGPASFTAATLVWPVKRQRAKARTRRRSGLWIMSFLR
jgi:hypothetical protein